MRHLFFIAVAFFIARESTAQSNNYSSSQDIESSIDVADNRSDWKAVQVISNQSILEDMIQGEKLSIKHKVYGKNIEVISEAEKEAMIKLKKLAVKKGYQAVAIEKIYSKVSGVPKRRYRIVKITALGYKYKN